MHRKIIVDKAIETEEDTCTCTRVQGTIENQIHGRCWQVNVLDFPALKIVRQYLQYN